MLAGQQHVQRVVAVVVPLGFEGAGAQRAGRGAAQQRGGVVLVLQHQVHVPPGLDRLPHAGGKLLQPVARADGVHGIQPQPVEAIFHQPHQRVVEEERAHFRLAEVDGGAPGRVHVVAEDAAGVVVQVVALRPEVVVDHVEEHHQP